MTGFAGVLTAITAKIQAVAGIGRVYDYTRLVLTESDIVADMVQSGRLHYWSVGPAQADPHIRERHPTTHAKATYQYDVHGYYALDRAGESQKDFSAIVRLVQDTFETGDKKLGGIVTECGPLQWRVSNEWNLANVLCHHVQLSIRVTEHPED